jgi:hypothetical protein
MEERYMTLTQIGEYYAGVSRVVAGRIVTNVGLRNADGTPTKMAIAGGYCKQVPDKVRGCSFFVWHAERTLALIDQCLQDPAAFAAARRERANARKAAEDIVDEELEGDESNH